MARIFRRSLALLTVVALAACSGKPPVESQRQAANTAHSAVRTSVTGEPKWTPTGGMALGRMLYTATRLADGRVLAAGGFNQTSELYDPATGTWARTGDTRATHRYHTATRLGDGRVLVAGGEQDWHMGSNAEVYDPGMGQWSPTGSMATQRSRHAAVLLPSGLVLVMGGTDSAGGVLSSAELYNPATGAWSPTGAMSTARSDHTATLLPSGHVLVAGGGQGGSALGSAEIYDPDTGTWTAAGSMVRPRRYHTATLLPSGKVLVAGSDSPEWAPALSSELYEPTSGTWTATGDMSRPRRYHTATLLPSGQVLVAGGFHEYTGISFAAELYDPATGAWSATTSMNVDRYGHTATLLSSGAVLAVGGFSNHDQTSAELYLATAPPPPEPVPTPLDDTRFTPVAEATEFLYSGPHAIQVGVAPGTIEARRATVLRGQVKTREGEPLSGVTVSILGFPKYGHTLTRANGMFDMVVNGGGLLTVQYKKEGHLPAQRQVQAPWADYAWLPEVILIPLDSQVTPIVLNGTSGYQVAQGSVTSDADGTRQATLLFPPGTQASRVLPDGSTQPLTTLHVRATEYTVGEEGPRTMPGALPSATGYTYAVELSVDEAMDWSGDTVVQEVRFSQPLFLYVDNFLDFPVGGIVPAGWYDRRAGVWKPSDNGRILRVLDIVNGLAMLDVTGDGVADEGKALSDLGLTEAERQRLAALFAPGKSFWRTPVSHFTPWDCNWPYGPPPDAEPPNQEPEKDNPEEDPACQSGSIIDCQNQALGESIPVVGTTFQLHYRSDRVPGRRTAHTLKIPLSGTSVAPSLLRIQLEIEVAGQFFSQSFPPTPNQTYTFEWNGRDAYGRLLQGQWPVKTRIGYVYSLIYQQPAEFSQSFGRLSGVPMTGIRGQRELTLWQEQTRSLGEWNVPPSNLGGWMLDVHHAYNPTSQTLYLGHGERRATGLMENKPVVLTVAGNGVPGDAGDGAPATQASLWNPRDVAFAPDGSLYIADTLNNRIRRVGPDRRISTLPGSEEYQPHYVEVGPDGSVYAAHTYLHCIRRIRPDGTATTFAGQCGLQGGDAGDGGPATHALLNYPQDIVMGRDGNLYIADFDNDRIRYVTPDGLIHTLAGKPQARGYCGDGGPASNACLNGPWGLAIDSEGSVYVSDSFNHRVRRISRDGLISTVAGTGVDGSSSPKVGDGGPARKALLSLPKGLAFDALGNLYIADHMTRIRRVSPDGTMTRFAGSSEVYGYGYNGEGMPTQKALFDSPVGIAAGPDGTLYVSDEWNYRIRRVGFVLPWLAENQSWVPSEDGSKLYVFSQQDRHLRTVDALTQVVLYEFGYDAAGRLTSIRSRDGLVTRIERDTSGKPLAIVAPHGQRTQLELDANGYLSAIINPAGERTELVHTSEGLLTALRDGRRGLHEFAYDNKGRLTKDTNAAGGFKELIHTTLEDGYSVVVRTALGRTTSYRVQNLSTGEQRRTTVTPSGIVSLQSRNPDASTTLTSADGTVVTTEDGPDARFGMQVPLAAARAVKLPSGLTQTVSQSRTVSLSTPEDVLSLATLTSTRTVNGLTSTLTYEAATRRLTQTSPMGKQITTTHDEKGKVVRVEVPGVLPVQYSYDGKGRLRLLTQGTRSSSFTYKPEGYLDTVTDALSHTVGYSYDLAGRVTSQWLPGNRQLGFSHDANGNLTSLTPPGRPTHSFSYGLDDLEENYVPPSLVGVPRVNTASQYNLDSQPKLSSYPDGATLEVKYEDDATQKKGRFLSAVLTPPGNGRYATRTRQASYYTGSGYLQGLTDSQGPSLSYSYDGPLVTHATWSGGVSGSVSYGYDTFFQVASVSVNGVNAITYAYDHDGLLQRAGSLELARDRSNGLLTGTSLGQVSTALGYNAYGEVETSSAFVGATPLYTMQLVRDDLGRISQKTETLHGTTHTYVYTYDTAGRVASVWEDGTLVAHATYDNGNPGNGNRTSLTQAGNTRVASYDAQDRLLSFGNTTYTYGPGGDVQSKQEGTQTSTYVYDAFGNLLAATLPNGTQLSYVVDAQDRRVGKKVNGTLVQGFLYDGQLRVIAELDGNNQIVSRFVYATWSHSPDWMLKGGVTYRILSDERGSPRLIVKASDGSVAQRLDYDAWGNVLSDSNPGFQPFGFAGGLYDRDTKLVRFGARDYDAEAGRWTTKDPIRFAGGDTNLYAYVANDPINSIDPSGLIIDTLLDVGFLVYDIYVIGRDNIFGDCDNLGTNLAALGLDAAAIVVPGVTGAGAIFKAGKAANGGGEKLVDLYRAVGPDELADIRATGAFRTLPGVAEGKYFTTSAEAAASYARQAVKSFGDAPYTIVHTQAPESVLRMPDVYASVDRGIPAYVIPINALPGLQPQILNYSPVP
ncbi:kelch repeat-containing protein [Archangium sp.]|uniref:NHL domain-containing protein n=1 Tax=Archangium sp. TaxID=1872627 RepID=UPI002D6C69B3|nr:kelch repeat-containing protein [Archangium sp.]HYO56161.1 kelch repeat-containing protein [Archangium sp.]